MSLLRVRPKAEESLKRLLASGGFRDSSLPLVAQSDMVRLISNQIRFKKHALSYILRYALHFALRLRSGTYCIGQAASMGALLLCGGTKGKRYALPNSNIMIHQVLGGAEGAASDVEIRVRYMLKLKQRLNWIISRHTGRSVEQVEKDCDRDKFMTPEEAKAYGLVDEVVLSRKQIPGLAETVVSPLK